jgi:hypothetical protein
MTSNLGATSVEEGSGSLDRRPTDDLAQALKARLLEHLKLLGVNGEELRIVAKDAVRNLHAAQRDELHERERPFLEKYGPDLMERHFACGAEIVPEKVRPILTEVKGDGEDARLFRLATLLWSVPVSRGFGRRMRFLVHDASNCKLMGLFALCDPVFNLKARDQWIGWETDDRRERLVNVMDAYVVGAVPPYDQMIGGKVVASLMTSREVSEVFERKYHDTEGIISGRKKRARLAMITVTSALGRSSLYNRLKLPGLFKFELIGQTQGWGHFHVPEDIFSDMRLLLEQEQHSYANGHRFGHGPNWRMRVIRVALKRIGVEQEALRHGITREIYAVSLASNWPECLLCHGPVCHVLRPAADDIGRRACERWLIPRAKRRPNFKQWTLSDTRKLLWLQSAR